MKPKFMKLFTTIEDGETSLNDSESLAVFALRNARHYFYQNRGSEVEPFGWAQDAFSAITSPFVFLYYFLSGPFLYMYNALPMKYSAIVREGGKAEVCRKYSTKGKLEPLLRASLFTRNKIIFKPEEGLEGKL